MQPNDFAEQRNEYGERESYQREWEKLTLASCKKELELQDLKIEKLQLEIEDYKKDWLKNNCEIFELTEDVRVK